MDAPTDFPGAWLVMIIVYLLSKLPVMTMCEVVVLHTDSMVMVLPDA